MSGRRGSNSPPIAWKAIALPTELLPLIQMTNYECGMANEKFRLQGRYLLTRTTLQYSSFVILYLPAERQVRHLIRGGNRIRTYEVIRQQIYSLSQLAALVFPQNSSQKNELLFLPFGGEKKTGVQNYTVLHFFKT